MTFIPPRTFAVGEVLSAVDMNVFVRDNTTDLDERLTDITDGDFSFRYAGSRVYTETGKFNRNDAFGNGIDTSWLRYVRGRMVGGGGAGSPGSSTDAKSVGAGGGSGAYTEFFYPYSFLLDDGDVEIGAGGAASLTPGDPTADGSATRFELSFGFLTVGGGGRGGTSTISQTVDNRAARGGLGGSVSGTAAGFLSFTPYRFANGQPGKNGWNGYSIVHAGDTTFIGGSGADSVLGNGGQPPTGKGDFTYRAGAGFGFGGAGAWGEANVAGQAGASGVVLLDFFR